MTCSIIITLVNRMEYCIGTGEALRCINSIYSMYICIYILYYIILQSRRLPKYHQIIDSTHTWAEKSLVINSHFAPCHTYSVYLQQPRQISGVQCTCGASKQVSRVEYTYKVITLPIHTYFVSNSRLGYPQLFNTPEHLPAIK